METGHKELKSPPGKRQMPAKARNLEIAFRMGSYTKVRLLEDVGRGKRNSHQNSLSDGCNGRVMVPRWAFSEIVGQSKQRMVPGFESLPTIVRIWKDRRFGL